MKKYWKLIVVFVVGIALGFSVGFGIPKPRPHFVRGPRMEHRMDRSQFRQHRFTQLDDIEKAAIDSLRGVLKNGDVSKEDRAIIRQEIIGIIRKN